MLEKVIVEIEGCYHELELSETAVSSVRGKCSILKKGDKDLTLLAGLIEALATGNEKAQAYARTLEETEAIRKPESRIPESVAISKLKRREPFSNLLAINSETLEAITDEMKKDGFHEDEPVRVWSEEGVVLDGHTRLRAAEAAGLTTVPVVRISFDSEDAAIEYAIRAQTHRRNLTDADYVRLVEQMDKKRARGGDRSGEANTSPEVFGSSAKETAKKLGISQTRVENARAVIDGEDTDVKGKVESGDLSLNMAAKQVRQKKKIKDKPSNTPGPEVTLIGPDYSGVLRAIGSAIDMATGDSSLIDSLNRVKDLVIQKKAELEDTNEAAA